jgi:hypothetical protein
MSSGGNFKEKGKLTGPCYVPGMGCHPSWSFFWSGLPKAVAEIAKDADTTWLQDIGDGKIGYSRAISAVGKKFIVEHYSAYGGPKPPPIDHQGINDAFVEKASIVRYYYRGNWLELTGAD